MDSTCCFGFAACLVFAFARFAEVLDATLSTANCHFGITAVGVTSLFMRRTTLEWLRLGAIHAARLS